MKKREHVIINSGIAKDYQLYRINDSVNNQVFGVFTQPFNSVFYQTKENNDYDKLYRYTDLLNKHLELDDYIIEPQNFASIYQLAKELKEFEIEFDLTDWTNQRKNYQVLMAVKELEMEFNATPNVDVELKWVRQGLSLSQIHYLEQHYTNNEEPLKQLDKNNHTNFKIFKALNPIKEIEHALFTMKSENLKNSLLIVDNKNKMLPLLKYACEKIGINYSSNTSRYDISNQKFVLIMEFLLSIKEQDEFLTTSKFFDMLNANVFNIDYSKHIYEYLNYFEKTYSDLKDTTIAPKQIFTKTLEVLSTNKNLSEENKNIIITLLESNKLDEIESKILNNPDISKELRDNDKTSLLKIQKDFITNREINKTFVDFIIEIEKYTKMMNDIILLNDLSEKNKQFKTLIEEVYRKVEQLDILGSQKLKKYLQNVFPLITDKNIHFVLHEIKNISTYHFETELFQVTDYQNAPLSKFENVFITGLNAQTYPNINERTGLVNEALLNALDPNKFSVEKRIKHELQQLDLIFKSHSKHLVIYFHELDLDGNTVDTPILNSINDAIKNNEVCRAFVDYEYTDKSENVERLSKEVVEKYILTTDKYSNKVLKMSATGLRLYADDPIQYIENKILDMTDHFNRDFDLAAAFGNLNHNILENHYRYKTNINDIYEDAARESLSNLPKLPYFNLLIDYNKEIIKGFIDFSDKELIEHGFISSNKKDNSFENIHVEEAKLKVKVKIDEHEYFALNGRIDRYEIKFDDNKIDEIRVVDYKSSVDGNFHSRNKLTKVTHLRQLQLLTYMKMVKEKYQSKIGLSEENVITGNFYYLTLYSEDKEFTSISKTLFKNIEFNETYHFQKLNYCNSSGKVRQKKHLENWELIFDEVLSVIYREVLDGNINQEDLEDKIKAVTY